MCENMPSINLYAGVQILAQADLGGFGGWQPTNISGLKYPLEEVPEALGSHGLIQHMRTGINMKVELLCSNCRECINFLRILLSEKGSGLLGWGGDKMV